MRSALEFSYELAFKRNIGWLTKEEQQTLRSKRVAIAGLGGVGGSHLLTLARLGIGAFNIADFDRFELPNFNRQAGAMMTTLGDSKTSVLARMARDINPELDLRVFDDGVTPANVDAFFSDVDLYVDSLDFFAFDARRLVFPACRARRIPATIVAPLGMGASLVNIVPDGMSFEAYFGWEDAPREEMALRFLIALSPALLQRKYLVDPTAVNLGGGEGPSTPMACELCAGVAATEALKILLGRGRVVAAPRGVHFDAYRNKLVHTWRPGGMRNPLQRITVALASRQLRRGRVPTTPL